MCLQERKKRQQISQGVTILKEGWADLKDETQDGDGAWEGHWFVLNSAGEFRVFPDAESTDEQVRALRDAWRVWYVHAWSRARNPTLVSALSWLSHRA